MIKDIFTFEPIIPKVPKNEMNFFYWFGALLEIEFTYYMLVVNQVW